MDRYNRLSWEENGLIEKSLLKDRKNEKKERQNKQKNIIIFELSESRKGNIEDRKEEDIITFMGLCQNICKVNIMEESLDKAGKGSEDKDNCS